MFKLQPFAFYNIGQVKPTSSGASVLSTCPPPAAALPYGGPALLRPCPALLQPCPALLPSCCLPVVHVPFVNFFKALSPFHCSSSFTDLLLSALFFMLVRSPTWSFENQKDIRKRPPGPVQNPQKDAVSDPQGFLGISKAFGFTKRNEVSRQCSAVQANPHQQSKCVFVICKKHRNALPLRCSLLSCSIWKTDAYRSGWT